MSTSPAPTPPHATNTTSPPPPATNSTSPTQPATNTASLPPATPAPSTTLSPPQSLPTGVTIVGMVIGGCLITLVIILGHLFFYFKKKVYHCPLPDGPYDLQPQHWQPNTPQPGSHAVNIPPIPSPPHAAMSPIPSTRVTFVSSERRFTFTYEELAKATDGFSKANVLGQGGFGYVYKGILPNGEEVAIKQLKEGSHQGDREFQAEVEIISRVHHRNLVTLVGYCIAGSHRILVYDFVPNNTLEFHLHSRGRPNMDWPTRLRSALGAAKGLAYLHEDCHPKIIHRDIKSANILLDYNFEAKVADFGLAKQCSSNTGTHISTKPMGTFGYLAPEYASKGILTEKVDVYSFGVMLLELITGRKALFSSPSSPPSSEKESLVDWARPLLPQALEEENFDGLVDPRLPNEYNHNEMLRMINCAACCVRLSAQHRPQMSQVVLALEGRLSLSNRDAEILGHNTASISHGSSDYDTSRARTMLGLDGTTLYVSFG